MKQLLYLVSFLLIGITACVNPKGAEVLAEAERLVQTCPDSALLVLEQVKKEAATYSRRNHMRYLLLQAEAMNKAYLPLDSITYMDEVLDYYLSHGDRDERMRACYLTGSIWRDRGNSPLALQYFRDAIGEADTTATDCNYAQVSRIYAQIASLFNLQRFPQMELEHWKQAMRYAALAKDTLLYIQCQECMGSAYYLMNKEDSVMLYAQKGYVNYLKYKKRNQAASTRIVVANYFLKHDSIHKAKQALDEYKNYSGYFNPKGDIISGGEIFYYYMGEYHEKTHQLDSALFYYRKLLNYPDDIMNLENGYKGLMSVYQRMHIADSVAKYARLYANANDSANIQNSANEIGRAQMLYDYSESQRIAAEKSEEAQMLWNILWLSLISVGLGVTLLYKEYRKQKTLLTASIQSTNRKYTYILLQYNKVTEELNTLKNNKQQFIKKKEQEIEQLRHMLTSYREHSSENPDDLAQNLLQHDRVKQMHQYAYRLIVPSDKEWSDLFQAAAVFLPDFTNKLNTYTEQLSTQERIVCLLVKLNFIPSEISVLLGISKQRITNIRSALNQKLFGERGCKTFDDNIHRM
ncbi:MAG TPA: hypothetical protein H9922_07920 [Candidatus Phocaeicola caecigallinarum]|nr:hypothetical protein [Candidatus Phocaeicola caecigallinarum]